MAEKLELTEREIALARGDNPDAPVSEQVADTAAVNQVTDEAAAPATEAKDGAEGQPAKDGEAQASSGSGTEAAGSTAPTSWVKDEHKQLAASFGIPDEDLNGFTSADEFNRAAKLLSRTFASAGQAAKQPAHPAVTQPVATPATPAATEQQPKKLAKLDAAKFKEAGYDEDTIALVNAHNDAIEQAEAQQRELSQMREQVGQFHRAMVEQDYVRRMNAFHDAVDSLGDSRFGKSVGKDGSQVSLSKDEDAGRAKLFNATDMLLRGIIDQAQASGRQPQVPPWSVLVQQARQLAFAEDIRAEERKKVQAQVTEQSKRRRSVAAVRNPVGQFATHKQAFEGPNATAKQLASNPRIMAAWKKMTEENGSDT
jgi:hypothetical protein